MASLEGVANALAADSLCSSLDPLMTLRAPRDRVLLHAWPVLGVGTASSHRWASRRRPDITSVTPSRPGTAANTAIGPREWRGPTRPVLDLNSQSPSEYFSRQPGAVREVDGHPSKTTAPKPMKKTSCQRGSTCPTGLIEVGFAGS